MSATEKIAIAIVDDHTLVRKGLAELIHRAGGYHVTLEAAHGKEFILGINSGARVEIAIVDLNMPVMDGYETMAWIRDNCPHVRSLALTFEGGEDKVIKAVRNGARGFILKDIEPEELKMALDHIHTSGYYHTDLVHNSIMANFDHRTSHERQQAQVLESLSEREKEFLKVVCSDDEPTYDEVGKIMGVHRRTVDGYREGLFSRFGLRSKTGLVLFAMKWGIVKP